MPRQSSVHYSCANSRWEILPLLEGDLDNLPPQPSRIIRIFLSSTFSDTTSERNALMERVYPSLKEFCRRMYGLDFQVIDLRWGIRDQSHNDHTIIEFCLKEIDKCKALSLGVNFVILMGQKYGYRPFPPSIDASEFQTIRKELERMKIKGRELLDDWFKINTNVKPALSVLQPISSRLPDYNNKEDPEKQRLADQQWSEIHSQIQKLLRTGVTAACVQNRTLQSRVKEKYFTSVTEYEIEKGLIYTPEEDKKNCLCFTRVIKNLTGELERSNQASRFIDVVNGGKTVDQEAQRLLVSLQNDKITPHLPELHSLRFDISWPDNLTKDRLPTDEEKYLHQFCNSFREKIQWLITRSIKQSASMRCLNQELEIAQQLEMCKTRCQNFRGREKSLDMMRCYLQQTSGHVMGWPLVVHGESGSGKTSLMAKTASLTKEWFDSKEDSIRPVIVIRFLGTTTNSCNIRLVLYSLCWQIEAAYRKRNKTEIPEDYLGLISCFNNIIQEASYRRPLILLLDGIDQLSETHRAHGLAWLPRALPQHVRVIISTLPNQYEILDTLNLIFPEKENFLEVTPLGSELSIDMIRKWLVEADRDLTAAQFDVVEKALETCSLPLYITLVFGEVSRWRSYTPIDETQLEVTVSGVINKLLDRVELYHGHTFVVYALSYITASKNGLSDIELEDILSLDDEVLNDVFQHWLPPVRRIPPLLIPRLLDELSSYIINREANESSVLYWYHNQFIEVAKQRYLFDAGHKCYIHTNLAHYFLGTWGGGKVKPFRYSQKQINFLHIAQPEGEADRKVPLQPLEFESDTNDLESKIKHNHRKLGELPYHLIMAKMHHELSKYVLFNYDWLHTKLSASSLHDVLADYYLLTASSESTNSESSALFADAQLMASALRVGGNRVNQNPDSLAFDLIGRLLLYYDRNEASLDDESNLQASRGLQAGEALCAPCLTPTRNLLTPITPPNPQSALPRMGLTRRKGKLYHDNIRSILQQCDTKSLRHSALLPLDQCFEAPTMMSLYVLEAHTRAITSLVYCSSTNELISASPGQLIFWDMKTGELNRNLDLSHLQGGKGRINLFLSNDCKVLVVDSDTLDSPVYVYDVKSLHLLHQCGCRTALLRRVYLAGDFLCRQRSIINIRTGGVVKSMDDFVPSKNFLPCALSSDGESILIAEGEVTQLFDFRTHMVLVEVPGKNVPSTLCFSNDNKVAFIGYTEDCNVIALNVERKHNNKEFGKVFMRFAPETKLKLAGHSLERAFLGKEVCEIKTSEHNLDKVLINLNEFNLILLNIRTEVPIVMETEAIKSAIFPRKLSIKEASFAGNDLVVGCVDRFIKLWSSKDGKLQRSIRLHTMPGFPLCIFRNYIATGSNIHTSLNVWDLDGLEDTKTQPEIKVYKSSIECLSAVPQKRLVFVRNSFPTSGGDYFKYLNSFGIDVWNISTGSCYEFLQFDKYGKLAQMEVSSDATQMALLLNAVRDWYVAVFRIDESQSKENSDRLGFRVFLHQNCSSFTISANWKYLATSSSRAATSTDKSTHEFKVWNISTGREIMFIKQGSCPVFTLDCLNLAYIDIHLDRTVVVHSLETMEHLVRIPCHAASILPIPVHRDCLLITSIPEGEGCNVSLWNYKKVTMIRDFDNVAPSGICDVTKDGSMCVDGYGNIYNLVDGSVIRSFASLRQHSLIRLTYDGMFIIWAEEFSIKVGKISSGGIIANTSTHEIPSSLHLMDFGYIVIVGRKDGHLLTMKLAVESEDVKVSYRPQNVADRRNFLLDTRVCSDKSIQIMDELYQNSAQCTQDNHLPDLNDQIRQNLLDRANVPHTVITTDDGIDSSTISPQRMGRSSPQQHARRSSSPGSHITDTLKKYHTPIAMAVVSEQARSDFSMMDTSDGGSWPGSAFSTLQRKSRSLQDVRLAQAKESAPSPRRSRSPAWFGKLLHKNKPFIRIGTPKSKDFRIRKGLEKTGIMMMKTLSIVPADGSESNQASQATQASQASQENKELDRFSSISS